MALAESISKRRFVVVVNYGFLLLMLLLSLAGFFTGWTSATIACFWISVAIVLATFYALHIRTGLWRLAHTEIDSMDEREMQQTLGALRHAYIVFTILTLGAILTVLLFHMNDQPLQLVGFWVLLYLAHTLPSSILAWTITQVPAQTEEC